MTWATPTAYDKKEVGETAEDSAPNDGPRPDRQRQRLEMRRFASRNVGSLTGKGKELVDEMKRRRIDIMGIQETKWGGNSARVLGDGYKVIYSGEVNKRNGVGVVVAEEWTKGVVSVDRVSDRLLAVKLVMGEELAVVISAYGPQTGCEGGEKERFMDELDQLVGKTELLIVCGDLNGHVGKESEGFKEVHGGHGYGNRNREGRSIPEMAQRRELVVCNTWYRKKEEHIIT